MESRGEEKGEERSGGRWKEVKLQKVKMQSKGRGEGREERVKEVYTVGKEYTSFKKWKRFMRNGTGQSGERKGVK